jgi:hypothetical protein
MEIYKVSLPKFNYWNDEFDSWVESSYVKGNAYHEKYNDDYEDDIIGSAPNGSYLDDQILIDNNDIKIID